MIDVKCKNCNKILAKAESMNAAIKCPRCYMIFEYKIFSNLFVNERFDMQNASGIMQSESNETTPHNEVTTSVID